MCHTYECTCKPAAPLIRCTLKGDMSHIWMHIQTRHVTQVDMMTIWYTFKWDVSHVWMRHHASRSRELRQMHQSYHTFEQVKSHVWMCHSMPYGVEARHTYQWVPSHIAQRHITHTNESHHTCPSHVPHVNAHIKEKCHTHECTYKQSTSHILIPVMSHTHTWMCHSMPYG